MSEFTKRTTKLITPLLKERGFKKQGPFDRGATHDFALYIKGDTQVRLTYSFHPYDYPDLGIRLVVWNPRGTLVDRLHRPTRGGVRTMLRAVAHDLECLLGPLGRVARQAGVARLRHAGRPRAGAPHRAR